jgi:hypothetical protein
MNTFLAVSYNQPKFCTAAAWNPNAETHPIDPARHISPYGFFIDSNDTLYIAAWNINLVQIWSNQQGSPPRNLSSGLATPSAVFATANGDIYIDNGFWNHRVDKWTLNATSSVSVMSVPGVCYGLFVDLNDTLYCSLRDYHQVVKRSLKTLYSNTTIAAAGSGIAGASSTQLGSPHGILVDRNFTLYVADYSNHRIQRFWFGDLNGTTVAGAGAPSTVTLNSPTGVVLDADGYLFIVEWGGHRIIGSGPDGFRCVAACSGIAGSTVNRLFHPGTMSFDSHGNIFVADTWNYRVQKFVLATKSCSKFFYLVGMKGSFEYIDEYNLAMSTKHNFFVKSIFSLDLPSHSFRKILEFTF